MSSNEFIDREHQLPADPHEIPEDVARDGERVSAMDAAPRGEPAKAFDARAVYDSRPLQGFDFNITDSGDLSDEGPTVLIGFNVPDGHVCVLRRIQHFFDPAPGGIVNRNDLTFTIKVNGGTYKYNENIPMGLESGDVLNCFVIADTGDLVQVLATLSATITITATLYVHFYGQFLLKTGIPAPFEVLNPTDKNFVGFAGQLPAPPRVRDKQLVTESAPVPAILAQSMPATEPVRQPAQRPLGNRGVAQQRTPVYNRRTGQIIGYR